MNKKSWVLYFLFSLISVEVSIASCPTIGEIETAVRGFMRIEANGFREDSDFDSANPVFRHDGIEWISADQMWLYNPVEYKILNRQEGAATPPSFTVTNENFDNASSAGTCIYKVTLRDSVDKITAEADLRDSRATGTVDSHLPYDAQFNRERTYNIRYSPAYESLIAMMQAVSESDLLRSAPNAVLDPLIRFTFGEDENVKSIISGVAQGKIIRPL